MDSSVSLVAFGMCRHDGGDLFPPHFRSRRLLPTQTSSSPNLASTKQVMSPMSGIRQLPAEIVHRIVSIALAEYLDDLLVGAQSGACLPFCRSGPEGCATRAPPDLVESLLVASYQLHDVSSKIISSLQGYLSQEEQLAGALDRSPWSDVAEVRALRKLSLTYAHNKIPQLAVLMRHTMASVLEGYRTVFCMQFQLAGFAAQMNSWRDGLPEQQPISAVQDLHSTCEGNQKVARNVRVTLARCPAAFRDVLAPRVDACRRAIAISYAYELYIMEFEMRWQSVLELGAADVGDPLEHEEPARDLVRLIEHIRDGHAGMRADWDIAVPLDEALGVERLLALCALLREITAKDPSDRLTDAQGAAQTLLGELEARRRQPNSPGPLRNGETQYPGNEVCST
ncbi:hypothetical protein PsYK624_137110 [Phanerochaete sordida]|uniref:Uncharacterized protein n=1 Tax=Phanerochaete sordida TaxID=48140 RepID=A0A9P3GLG6_9APHY|nr:hypothetical protein PsYK624_137110 [Phanerochaete sordida]